MKFVARTVMPYILPLFKTKLFITLKWELLEKEIKLKVGLSLFRNFLKFVHNNSSHVET